MPLEMPSFIPLNHGDIAGLIEMLVVITVGSPQQSTQCSHLNNKCRNKTEQDMREISMNVSDGACLAQVYVQVFA